MVIIIIIIIMGTMPLCLLYLNVCWIDKIKSALILKFFYTVYFSQAELFFKSRKFSLVLIGFGIPEASRSLQARSSQKSKMQRKED